MSAYPANLAFHPYYSSWQKRSFDLIVASGLLALLLPLFLIIGGVILISAGWPVLYLQNRTGKNKKVFKIIKFRTMYVGAEKNQWRYAEANQAPEPMYKNWADPRFVGMGRGLAKLGLDELPQLVNILKGEMSFVGPRPLPCTETKKLNQSWNFRYQVRPGIFSQWSAAASRHYCLKKWQNLEKATLKKGGLKYELKIIWQTLVSLL